MGDRRAPARRGDADAAGRRGIHGQCLRADAAPRLRRAARHARRRREHAARLRIVNVILLGPQRRPTIDAVVAALGIDGPIATITAGWQERESDDGELGKVLGGRDLNLRLYERWLDVQDRDTSFAAAERRLAELLMEVQDSYLLRLDYALRAVYALLRRASELRGEFYQDMQPHDRPVIAEHRAEVAAALGGAAAVVIAGGHVGVLADVLHLFNVAAAVRSPVIAWSAGAMALTERIVLFHDRSAHGPGHPE